MTIIHLHTQLDPFDSQLMICYSPLPSAPPPPIPSLPLPLTWLRSDPSTAVDAPECTLQALHLTYSPVPLQLCQHFSLHGHLVFLFQLLQRRLILGVVVLQPAHCIGFFGLNILYFPERQVVMPNHTGFAQPNSQETESAAKHFGIATGKMVLGTVLTTIKVKI